MSALGRWKELTLMKEKLEEDPWGQEELGPVISLPRHSEYQGAWVVWRTHPA